ncbi:hypothetical protein WKI68_36765 [Streptomyces sp. MS1.HAVA.3]|uniref:Uncharacterized protein n=1 Tax=Streptomyces caledonius TaxID=3134107 RepID=A0ABU8UC96_9ACTN
MQAALKRAGRQLGIAAEADRHREVFRTDWSHQLQLVEDALAGRCSPSWSSLQHEERFDELAALPPSALPETAAA